MRLFSLIVPVFLSLVSFSAFAEGEPTAIAEFFSTPTGQKITQFGPLVLLALVFYFLIIRPQSKRTKAHRALLADLKSGDEVMTSSGVSGVVESIDNQFVTLLCDAESNTKLRFQKSSINQILPKGTLGNR